eukprot:GHVN01084441.1.p1 GENE.GHVN01084441.1~~GHVN01084441.1.p1  ORF type:complete len:275 (-),score=39.17 GHVN01084441.1:340-1077(-)
MIKGFCNLGNLPSALHYYTSLKAAGLSPDHIVFNTLLEGLARRRWLNDGERMMNEMLAYGVRPCPFTLTTLIHLYGGCGQLDQALFLADEFPRLFGFAKDGHVYSQIVSACVQNERFDLGLSYFRQLLSENWAPAPHTVVFLLKHCCRSHLRDEAMEIYQSVRKLGFSPAQHITSMLSHQFGPEFLVEAQSAADGRGGAASESVDVRNGPLEPIGKYNNLGRTGNRSVNPISQRNRNNYDYQSYR